MVFTSFAFLFVFLPLLLATYYAVPRAARNLVLLAFSYAFYSWWRLDFALLLVASTLVDYGCGLGMARRDGAHRRAFLVGSIGFNLGILAYFKYANFGIENAERLLLALGVESAVFEGFTEIILPVGISFITFQTMSYSIDVYRGVVAPTRNFAAFATYVSLFPQLIAGPIVRYKTVASQLIDRRATLGSFAEGTVLFLVGFNKKVLLANNFGLAADEVFNSGAPGMSSAWLGLLAYTFQIYFDFSGYSDMAVGLGRMLGFELPRNFDAPYRSQSITEFWRRWHMTLSEWIRDYLYISLGGNRGGTFLTYRNLALSMFLAGLWHGANWTFVVWGSFHGSLLILERVRGGNPLYAALPKALRLAFTWLLVMLGWMVFRSDSLADAARYAGELVNVGAPGFAADVYWLVSPSFIATTCIALAIVFRGTDSFRIAAERPLALVTLNFALFFCACSELFGQDFNPFLYFQF